MSDKPRPRTFVLVLWIALAPAFAATCMAKPTREQIVASAEKSKAEQRRMDLVAEFGADFSGLDLSGVDFRGYYRRGFETILRNADFSNCNLQGAVFGSAILDGADLTGSNLQQAHFVTASLKQAKLTGVDFTGTRIYQTDLSRAKLSGADLSSADITGSTFDGADLSDARLSGAKNEYWWNHFEDADLTRADLSSLNLRGACFRSATLRDANLAGAQLVEANFALADLTGTNFHNANVESAVFVSATGLSDDHRKQLEARAQRWKFDLKKAFDKFLSAMYLPTYGAVVVTLVVLTIAVVRRSDRSQCVKLAAVLNLLALLTATVCYFMMSQASSTMQFNAGSPEAMRLWSMWVSLFPPLMMLLLACFVVAAGATLAFLGHYWRWTTLKQMKLPLAYMLLTVVHCWFAITWVAQHAPTA